MRRVLNCLLFTFEVLCILATFAAIAMIAAVCTGCHLHFHRHEHRTIQAEDARALYEREETLDRILEDLL